MKAALINGGLWRRVGAASPLIAASLLLTACSSDRPELAAGETCDLTTECAIPLVCRFEQCRRQCATTRDCPDGSFCVFDRDKLGFCLLEPETRCLRASDCAEPLVCQFGRCSNVCAADRDCPAGARCDDDGSGSRACRDTATLECRMSGECPEPLVCAVDNRCREECLRDRDCRDGMLCTRMGDAGVCDFPDAGVVDAGPGDAAPPRDAVAGDTG